MLNFFSFVLKPLLLLLLFDSLLHDNSLVSFYLNRIFCHVQNKQFTLQNILRFSPLSRCLLSDNEVKVILRPEKRNNALKCFSFMGGRHHENTRPY